MISLIQESGWQVVVFSTPTGTRFAELEELERLTGQPVRWEYRMPAPASGRPRLTRSAGAEAAAELRLEVSSSKHQNGLSGYILTPAGNFNVVRAGERWKLTLSASGQVPAFAIEKGKFDLAPDETAIAGGAAKVLAELLPPAGSSGPVAMMGNAPGTRLELSSVSFGAHLFFSWSARRFLPGRTPLTSTYAL